MIEYRVNPGVGNRELNELFGGSWEGWKERDFGPVLARSLGYVGAFEGGRLIGFVNLAWDGGVHAFLLDTTVHPSYRRRGVGKKLVEEAVGIARHARVEWVHVDFEEQLAGFYRTCGFRSTAAGVVRVG